MIDRYYGPSPLLKVLRILRWRDQLNAALTEMRLRHVGR